MIEKDTIKTLEFDKVLKIISGRSRSRAGERAVLDIRPLSTLGEIKKRGGEIGELIDLYKGDERLAISRYEDIRDTLKRVKPEGAMLDSSEYLHIRGTLSVMGDIAVQMCDREDMPLLGEVTQELTGFPPLLKLLVRTFDREGKVVDEASPLLAELRKKLRAMNSRVGKRLEEITRDEKIAPFLQDDFITRRGERWVIPVRMDSKGQVAGVVHDVSNTGETAFVEPLEIIGLVNELENLIADEKAEVIKILRRVCVAIREVSTGIEMQFNILVYLDMLNSIAGYAHQFGMNRVRVNESRDIFIKGGKHPLLMAQLAEGAIDNVVPLHLSLEKDKRVMVITGPNAGGKTITIKTAGLLILMGLSGMPVPAEASSTIPLVKKLLVDIGDEQSIESSHSTFSAHVSRISAIIDKSDAHTLALLDEVGTGTEPLEGAAIACGVLKELKERGAIVFATTHLTDIVAFVQKGEGMINASMAFDRESHRPLYRLKEGEPGESHAIETASRFGLPENVITFAREMMGGMKVELQELMVELKEKSDSYEKARLELSLKEKALENKEARLASRLEEAKEKRQRAYREAYEEMKNLVVSAKREIRDIIDEGKKGKGARSLKKLEKKRLAIEEKLEGFSKVEHVSLDTVKKGEEVFVRTLGVDAEVIAVDEKRKRVTVEAGGKTIEVPLKVLSPPAGKPLKGIKKESKVYLVSDEQESSIKLLGLRVEEALNEVEVFIDSASMKGMGEVKIIHGVGTGALMKAVREYLEGHKNVVSYRRGEQGEGGDGVTIVTLV
ncbi:MAG: endonuclease MutS2 [Deltaproteobacteria bacterium]|nr:endonuclease MutS2 [Deltaproteobacteria bacterium]